MFQGFNNRCRQGKSTLYPSPLWHYPADFLNIEFCSDPTAVAAVLPPHWTGGQSTFSN
jgi:hypothetical protein